MKFNLLKNKNLIILLIFFLLIIINGIQDPLLTKLKEPSRPFVTVRYQGELGNRYFQTAAAIAYALDHNFKLIIPKEYLSSKSFRLIFRLLPFDKKPLNAAVFEEKDAYNYQPIPKIENVELRGFFISENYFKRHKKTIQKLLSPPKKLQWYLQRKYPKILSHPLKVGLHIRTYYKDFKGTGKKLYDFYPAPDLEYIRKAIEQFPEDALFIVCSDHINWCKKQLNSINRNFYFVENERSYHDFCILTLCNHMITSNSTFSWWAAYLIANPQKKVIARTPWLMNDQCNTQSVIPQDWIVIEGQHNPPIPEF
ncbi:MAG: hypothetical protein COT84_01015 [Chlamydiae bacterium CG10_big_fil_rev_8_21_14_0_10_35_9]|nr:MAG: hypothetical protein COT84_01015 [Chlamydiae bacterium CG10_big_fil_rev_8_21_14_0_10_35_9]